MKYHVDLNISLDATSTTSFDPTFERVLSFGPAQSWCASQAQFRENLVNAFIEQLAQSDDVQSSFSRGTTIFKMIRNYKT